MQTVSKGILKAKMLEYFRRIEQTGEAIIVTDHRVPVLKISPIKPRVSPDQLFADVRGKIKYHGDLLEETSSEWEET